MNKILQFLNRMFFYLSPLGTCAERSRIRGVRQLADGVGIRGDENSILSKEVLTPNQKPSTINYQLTTIFFFLLFTVYCSLLTAQTFPVQVIPQALPPAPIYVSNYADASAVTSPLRVQIILNDFEIANREIRLKTYFSGSGLSFQSNDLVVGASPLFLEGGIPLILTNAELAPYFEFNNITGINASQYGNAIPEGAYQFCVEVYDVLTGSRLSNKSCAVSVVFQNEPPFLVLPRNKTNVDEVNPQYIVFQWTPRSINVSNVEYELSLVEIWDTQVDPQQAFLSSQPVFQTTTSSTTYVYGPADPLLLSGKNYAWRVQAKAKQGTEEIGLFKNQGFSEIYSFSYASSCDLPLAVNHEVKGSTNANIFWDDFGTEIPEFTVRYRKKSGSLSGAEANEWFESKTTTNLLTLWDLKAGTTYEYQVNKKCAVTESDWSFSKQFITFIADDEASVYECGIQPDFNITNQDPLQTIGDKFTAGDFPIKVLEANGSNGRFTGKGYVTIPYLSSIRVGVEFTNVLINTDNQLLEGSVITMYDPTLGNILDIDAAIDLIDDITDTVGELFEGDNDLDEMRVNFSIPKDKVNEIIKVVDGNVVITNPANGESISEPLGDDKVVVDKDGQVYHIDAGGNITEGGQIDPGGSVNSGNVDGVSNNGSITELTAKGIQITFKDTNGIYGFDEIPNTDNSKINKEYTIIPDADGKDYVLVHQAVEKGRTATITAVVDQSSGTYELSEIVFKTKTGEVIPSQISGNEITLTVKGNYTFENETIYAVVPSKEDASKQLTAGAFTLWHLTDRAIDVVLVSVDNAPIPSGTETTIQNIFKKGAATINIDRKTATLDNSLLGADNKLEIADSPWLVAYNDEQKAVISNLKSQIDYSENKYYLFVFKSGFDTTKPIAGFMPLQRQFGFLFNGGLGSGDESKGDLGTVAAHEIGHGVFALQHPFTQYGSARETTDWLMDYKNNKVLLSHMDWAQMHDPALKFYIFQDEEDGESATVANIEGLSDFKNPDGTYTFISRAGKPITVPADITSVTFSTGDSSTCASDQNNPFRILPFGTLSSFVVNGKIYTARWKCEENRFSGYAFEGATNYYTDSITNSSIVEAIVGFPALNEANDLIYKVGKTEITAVDGGENYKAEGDYAEFNFLASKIGSVSKFNTVYAKFDPEYDPEVKKFIVDNITNKGFDGQSSYDNDAYVFMHATQLQKHEILKGCFKSGVPGELLNLITKHIRHYSYNGISPGSSYTEEVKVFKDSHEEDADEYNAKSLINNWKEYNFNYYPIISEAINNFNIPEDITADELIDLFNDVFAQEYDYVDVLSMENIQFSDNWDCLWNQISFDDRLRMLLLFTDNNEDDWGNETENIILKVFSDSDGILENENRLITFLKDENYKRLKIIFNILNDSFDNRNPQLDKVVAYLSKWLIKRAPENFKENTYSAYSAYANTLYNEFDYRRHSSFNVIPFTRSNWLNVSSFEFDIGPGGSTHENDYLLESSFNGEENKININVKTDFIDFSQISTYWDYFSGPETTFDNTYDPFDYVLLNVWDDFEVNGVKFNHGDILIVPVIYLHWLDTSIDGVQNEAALRVALDVLAIASAPITAGSSTALLVLETGMATADIIFTLNYDGSQEGVISPEFYDTWTAIYGLYNLQHLPKAFIGIGQASKSLFNYIKVANNPDQIFKMILNLDSLDDFLVDFKFLSRENQLSIIFKIDELILAGKNQATFTNIGKRIFYRSLINVRARCYNIFSSKNINIVVEASDTPFQPYLVFNYSGTSISLGKIEVTTDKTLKIVNSTRWLPAGIQTEKIAEINDVVYFKDGVTKTNTIDIVEDISKPGQLYLNPAISFEQALKNSHPNLWSKYNVLSAERKVFFDADFYLARADIIDELDQIANYNQFDKFVEAWIPNRNSNSFRDMLPKGIDEFKTWWYPKINVSSSTSDLLYTSQKAFEQSLNNSVTNIQNLPSYVRGEFWNYYRQRKWDQLEALANEYQINKTVQSVNGVDIVTLWPPGGGGYNNLAPRVPNIKEKFTRYSGDFGTTDDGLTILAGGYTSPGTAADFNFDQRALNLAENQYDYFYEIEILDNSSFTLVESTVIPWFNYGGNGQQALFTITELGPNRYPKSWTQLAQEGKVKITIIDSPSGNRSDLVGSVIGGPTITMSYKAGYDAHMIAVQEFTQTKAVVGGHNETNFENYLSSNNIEINRIETNNGDVDGIKEIKYQIKKADGSGEWKTRVFPKTVYDPDKISDAKMIVFGKEAMAQGLNANDITIQPNSTTIIRGESSNGIKFLGYQNPSNGEIINFHPVINFNN